MNTDRWRWVVAPFLAARALVPDGYPLLKLAVPTQLACLLAAWLLGSIFGVERPPIGCEIGVILGLLLALGGEVAYLTAFYLARPYLGELKLPGYIQRLLDALRRSHTLDLVATCATVGFVEELFFRGALTSWLGWGPSILIFAVLHRPRVAFHWVTLSGLGALFTFEVHLTGGLLIPMIHHALHDLLALSVVKVMLSSGRDIDLFT